MIRTYSELKKFKTMEERYNYLKLTGEVGKETFGYDRQLNQHLYRSKRWKDVRRKVILRDNGCDLGVDGYQLDKHIIIHHMNPITLDDVLNGNENVYNPEYLICVSHTTHNAIHYGDINLLPKDPVVRRPGDTCLW